MLGPPSAGCGVVPTTDSVNLELCYIGGQGFRINDLSKFMYQPKPGRQTIAAVRSLEDSVVVPKTHSRRTEQFRGCPSAPSQPLAEIGQSIHRN
jgi:hypothetical protein